MKRIETPPEVCRAAARLRERGFSCHLVGGCVRDSLRGLTPHDFDLCTSALPQQVMEVFQDQRVIATGLVHGTVTVLWEGMPLEITTLRVDGSYSDGRHPDEVSFTGDVTLDLARRDYTINAMAWDPLEQQLLDPFGGQEDLEKRCLRCVGDPDRRFGEDALRILRGLRFASTLGFGLEAQTAESLVRNRALLDRVARERVREEWSRLLCGVEAVQVLRQYREVAAQVIPALAAMFDYPQRSPWHRYDVWEHTLHALEGSPPELVVRLALLLHDVGKPETGTVDEQGVGHFYGHARASTRLTEEILRELRYDNDTRQAVVELVRHHDALLEENPVQMKRWLRRMGESQLRRWLEVRRGDIRGQGCHPERLADVDRLEGCLERILAEKEPFSVRQLAVNGRDVLECGIPPGPAVGQVLERLLEEVWEDSARNQREWLLKRIREHGKNDHS
ncbi:MAG: CCA tRNA nucleotidyltransferase [Eubacteriales bacterium]|jgi:tRNA nucleotidyltransferase (CCA-adding enzyme)